jgi:hypothetical protein
LLTVGRIMIHLYAKYCDMSHEMAISIINTSKGWAGGFRKSI